MIGVAEIIFSLFMFCMLWFVIFKFKLMYDKKKKLKNIPEKIEKQNKRFFSDGKEVNLKKELGLKDKTVQVPEEKKE